MAQYPPLARLFAAARIGLGLSLAAGLCAPAGAALRINEVQTGGALGAADEFVEIVNTAAEAADLTGWKLVYRSASAATDTLLLRFAAGTRVPPGGVLVYGGAAFTGPRDGAFSGSLAATAGGVGLRDAEGRLVDSVAYGPADNGFEETRPTVAPEKGHSIHRIPCRHDTGDNARDFQELIVPTPRETCAGIRAPSVSAAAFAPAGAWPGNTVTLTVGIATGTRPTLAVTADLSALGGSAAAPLAPDFGDAWWISFPVPSNAPPGPATIRIHATDAAGGEGYGAARLYVKDPVPAAVVIHEVQTGGATADEEFVELHNRTDAEVDISGCRLVYRGASSENETTLHTFAGARLAPRGYYLLGTATFGGPKDATFKAGLSGSGGGLALRSPAGNMLDSVGYGTADNLFVETAPAPAPEEGQSIERAPTGADTNDNAADFRVNASPTPTPAVNKPVIRAVEFVPAAAPPGARVSIAVRVAVGDAPITDAAADLIVIGGDTNHPLTRAADGRWTAEIIVAPLTTMGHKTITVYARDSLGLVATGTGRLTVTAAVPNPPLKVNEVQTGGAASGADEFVELYNPTDVGASLAGWTLVYRSEKGASDTVLYRFPSGQAIGPRGHLLLAGADYAGPRDGKMAALLAPAAGAVGLRDPLGMLVDSVGYGTAANALVETAPAPAPEPGRSIERRAPGHDTDHNAADFAVRAVPTPQAGGAAQPGDLNRDGRADLADALLALRIAAGLLDAQPFHGPAGETWPDAPHTPLTVEHALRILRPASPAAAAPSRRKPAD